MNKIPYAMYNSETNYVESAIHVSFGYRKSNASAYLDKSSDIGHLTILSSEKAGTLC